MSANGDVVVRGPTPPREWRFCRRTYESEYMKLNSWVTHAKRERRRRPGSSRYNGGVEEAVVLRRRTRCLPAIVPLNYSESSDTTARRDPDARAARNARTGLLRRRRCLQRRAEDIAAAGMTRTRARDGRRTTRRKERRMKFAAEAPA